MLIVDVKPVGIGLLLLHGACTLGFGMCVLLISLTPCGGKKDFKAAGTCFNALVVFSRWQE